MYLLYLCVSQLTVNMHMPQYDGYVFVRQVPLSMMKVCEYLSTTSINRYDKYACNIVLS